MRRRASHASRAAVSGLIGPAPSSSAGSSSLRCTISVVGLRRGPPSAAESPPCRASVTSASAVDCCHSRTVPLLFVGGALGLGEAADRLLERGAVLERQLSTEDELAPPIRPRHTQRATRIQLLVVGDLRRHDRTRRQRDLTRRLADRDARDLGIALGGVANGAAAAT